MNTADSGISTTTDNRVRVMPKVTPKPGMIDGRRLRRPERMAKACRVGGGAATAGRARVVIAANQCGAAA